MDYSPPGSTVHGILQARILEWVAVSFSSGSSWPRDQTHVSSISRQALHPWAIWEALWPLVVSSENSDGYCVFPLLRHTPHPCRDPVAGISNPGRTAVCVGSTQGCTGSGKRTLVFCLSIQFSFPIIILPIKSICATPLKFPLPFTVNGVSLSTAILPERELCALQQNLHPWAAESSVSSSDLQAGNHCQWRDCISALLKLHIGILLLCGLSQTIRVTWHPPSNI